VLAAMDVLVVPSILEEAFGMVAAEGAAASAPARRPALRPGRGCLGARARGRRARPVLVRSPDPAPPPGSRRASTGSSSRRARSAVRWRRPSAPSSPASGRGSAQPRVCSTPRRPAEPGLCGARPQRRLRP
jgi:hypothetical protein